MLVIVVDSVILNEPRNGQSLCCCIFRDYISDMVDSEKKFICFAHHKVVMDGICEVINGKMKE